MRLRLPPAFKAFSACATRTEGEELLSDWQPVVADELEELMRQEEAPAVRSPFDQFEECGIFPTWKVEQQLPDEAAAEAAEAAAAAAAAGRGLEQQ